MSVFLTGFKYEVFAPSSSADRAVLSLSYTPCLLLFNHSTFSR